MSDLSFSFDRESSRLKFARRDFPSFGLFLGKSFWIDSTLRFLLECGFELEYGLRDHPGC